MESKQVRLLRADEVECRVGRINDKGLSLLLYKDARVDINLLNETFTPMGWKKSYQSINGELFASVDIYDEDKKEWVSKQDVGTASFADSEKGRASDAFKRAAFCWGIGIELYSTPYIYINSNKYEAEKTDNGYKVKDKFHVSHIGYNDRREISELRIANQKGEVVYELKAKKKREKKADMQLTIDQVNELHREMNRAGVNLDTVLGRYGISGINEMTPIQFEKAMRSLKKTEKKVA